MSRRLIPFVAAASLTARMVLPGSHLAMIVNRANPVGSLSRRELRAIFLGEQTTWQHGRRTTPALREPGQPERAADAACALVMDER